MKNSTQLRLECDEQPTRLVMSDGQELPFVVGVISNLSGHRRAQQVVQPEEAFQFVRVDRANFNAVIKRMAPRLSLLVENEVSKEGASLAIELSFESFDDFSPLKVAQQIEPLASLLEKRTALGNGSESQQIDQVLSSQLTKRTFPR